MMPYDDLKGSKLLEITNLILMLHAAIYYICENCKL